MAYRNGYIPSHALKKLPGNNAGWLRGYAYAYWALHYRSVKNGGPSLAIYDGPTGRTYRSYARQVQAKRIYGRNAAYPGTSNHGWGRAVDLQSYSQRRAVDRWGAPYGLQKRWSDASWEWWHIRGMKSMAPAPRPDPLRHLKGADRRAADRLLYHRKEMARERRSGMGPRYRRQLKWARFWKARIERRRNDLAKRGHAGSRTHVILGQVLKATDGRM